MNRRKFAQQYRVLSHDLEKFNEVEFKKLEDICSDCSLDPRPYIENYGRALKLIAFTPHKQIVENYFSSLHSLLFFVDNFSFEKEFRTPLSYLESTPADYYASIDSVKHWVLPEEKKDPRVKPILEKLMNEISIYEPQLQNLRVGLLISGSFYFGDPSIDPDLDFDFVYYDNKDNPNYILQTIVKEINNESSISLSLDGGYIPLTEFSQDLKILQEKNYASLNRSEIENLGFFYISNSLMINPLNMLPFCDSVSVERSINRLQNEIQIIASQNPIYRALLIHYNDKIINDRSTKVRPVYCQ